MKDRYTRIIYNVIKRGFDTCSAVLMLGVTSPLFVVIALFIKRESRGPAFFIHERVGREGRSIGVYKFRTMNVGSENPESLLNEKDIEEYYLEYKLKNDPRVTALGNKLRRSCLDELPQLLNILKGDMSFVGPRPVTRDELAFYTDEEVKKLLSVRPGLTGYWQITGKGNANYQNGKRQKKELFYAENASIKLDAGVLLRTPGALLRRSDEND